MSDRRDPQEARGDTLDRLLEAEAGIETRLNECQAEAEGLVEQARVEAERREHLLEEKLREERTQRIRRREAEIVETTRAQRSRAADEIRWLRSLSTGRIDRIARKVLERLLPGSPT